MNNKEYEVMLSSALKSMPLAAHHISSFEYFVEYGLQKIIETEGIIEPVIKPANYTDFKIKVSKITIGKPDIIESDSIIRPITPIEARIRDLTYDAPLMITVSYIGDGKVIAEEEVFIGRMPIVVKSKYCNLYGMSKEDLIKNKEDPTDPGGYFIINGTERIIITTEDLAPNNILINKDNQEGFKFSAKIFADADTIKVPHTLQLSSSNLLYITFGKLKKVPVVVLIKALGVTSENEMIKKIAKGNEDIVNTVDMNLIAFNVSSEDDALDSIGKMLHSVHTKETAELNIDSLLFPFFGRSKESRKMKAEYLMYVSNLLIKSAMQGKEVDKDHYSNKRLHAESYNLDMLFRFIFKQILNDAKYNFEKGIRKDKIPNPKYIFTSDQLTARLRSSLATGQWVGGRVGITQHLDRRSFPATVSHLRKVESLLTSNRENYRARDLHGTQFGRFCAVETPEGPKIGLTKNLATLSMLSKEGADTDAVKKLLKDYGVKGI
ncbi:MAG: RNA polymerase [Candidatus Parvarchaeum acidophilus ARMAN-5_'5-way FS']|jgi:DNA-directed RNA polymerase subunit B"|uniref:DNA-directed RNA polymerase n=2 Tax=Parvarchaeum acidophilus TaxID=662761 RepID=D6GWV5_PARA5|nr:MAG: RNA polymerase beta subunit [Candidatus Parvarchaeum acidophilus ARMAN-5]EGD71960.1 MAG: RNA polymerase [Candidatus Parvarchaeum acidophilus ARMAN-5_'5-way FS']